MLRSSLAFALLGVSAFAQTTNLTELETSTAKIDFQNIYDWQGPDLWTPYDVKLNAGGRVAWEMQGAGTDQELVVYETQWVHFESHDGGKLPE